MTHAHKNERPALVALSGRASLLVAGALASVLAGGALSGCFGGHVAGVGSDDASYGLLPDLGPLCTGNNNGIIEAGELSFPVGATVRYLINPAGTTVQVAPAGTIGASGPEWDFRSTAGDVQSFTLESPAGAWWEKSFPGATYAVLSDVASGTLGVFRVAADGLYLLGFVSEDAGRTLLIYDAGVLSLRFPAKKGDGWVATGKITGGTLDGKPFASTDTYRITVSDVGVAVLPYLRFDHTLRVRLDSSQALPAGISVNRIQYLYYHECYGELGRMVSTIGETDDNFSTAAEFRRLAL